MRHIINMKLLNTVSVHTYEGRSLKISPYPVLIVVGGWNFTCIVMLIVYIMWWFAALNSQRFLFHRCKIAVRRKNGTTRVPSSDQAFIFERPQKHRRPSMKWKQLIGRMPHHMTLNTVNNSSSVVGYLWQWLPFQGDPSLPLMRTTFIKATILEDYRITLPSSPRCQDQCGVCGENHSWPFAHAKGVCTMDSKVAHTSPQAEMSQLLWGSFGPVPKKTGRLFWQTNHTG